MDGVILDREGASLSTDGSREPRGAQNGAEGHPVFLRYSNGAPFVWSIAVLLTSSPSPQDPSSSVYLSAAPSAAHFTLASSYIICTEVWGLSGCGVSVDIFLFVTRSEGFQLQGAEFAFSCVFSFSLCLLLQHARPALGAAVSLGA